MVKHTMIDADKAPPRPPKTQTRMAKETSALVGSLTPGKVARVEATDGETLRGIKASVTRAGKRMGKNVRSWDHEGVVYVELV